MRAWTLGFVQLNYISEMLSVSNMPLMVTALSHFWRGKGYRARLYFENKVTINSS